MAINVSTGCRQGDTCANVLSGMLLLKPLLIGVHSQCVTVPRSLDYLNPHPRQRPRATAVTSVARPVDIVTGALAAL